MTASHFVNVSEEVTNAMEENSIARSTKNYSALGGTLFKRKIKSFCWFNWINMLKLFAYLDTSNHHNCNNMHNAFFLSSISLFIYRICNSKPLEQLYLNNYTPQARWILLLNNSRDKVEEIIQQIMFTESERLY